MVVTHHLALIVASISRWISPDREAIGARSNRDHEPGSWFSFNRCRPISVGLSWWLHLHCPSDRDLMLQKAPRVATVRGRSGCIVAVWSRSRDIYVDEDPHSWSFHVSLGNPSDSGWSSRDHREVCCDKFRASISQCHLCRSFEIMGIVAHNTFHDFLPLEPSDEDPMSLMHLRPTISGYDPRLVHVSPVRWRSDDRDVFTRH